MSERTGDVLADIDALHAEALIEHARFLDDERHELAWAETQAAADWPDHWFDWSEPD